MKGARDRAGALLNSVARRRDEVLARGIEPRFLLVDRATACVLTHSLFPEESWRHGWTSSRNGFYVMGLLVVVVPVPEMLACVGSAEDELRTQ